MGTAARKLDVVRGEPQVPQLDAVPRGCLGEALVVAELVVKACLDVQ